MGAFGAGVCAGAVLISLAVVHTSVLIAWICLLN